MVGGSTKQFVPLFSHRFVELSNLLFLNALGNWTDWSYFIEDTSNQIVA